LGDEVAVGGRNVPVEYSHLFTKKKKEVGVSEKGELK